MNVSSDVERPYKKAIDNALWSGVLIGIGIALCIFGALQGLVQVLIEYEMALTILKLLWYDIPWYYWMGPFGLLIWMYHICWKAGVAKLEGK